MNVFPHEGPPTTNPVTVQCVSSLSGDEHCVLECDQEANVGWIRSKVAEFLEIESYRIKLSRGLSLLSNDNVKIHDVMDGWKNTQEGNVIEITVMTADETRKTMEKLREVDTIEDFRLLMYPPGLFENLGNEDEVYQTVKEWLREAAKESRDHIAVGADHDCSLRYLVPTPEIMSCTTWDCLKAGSQSAFLLHSSPTSLSWRILLNQWALRFVPCWACSGQVYCGES